MEISLIEHNQLFPFHEESYRMSLKLIFMKIQDGRHNEPMHGTRFDLGNTKILELDNITITKL